jgi:predicted oxidoreductase
MALGTWRLPGAAGTVAGLHALISTALDVGITTLDTAEIYGGYTAEALVGDVLRHDPGLRARVEIVTKAGIYVPGGHSPGRRVAHYNASAAQLVQSAETSLRLLGVDRLDVFLVHRPDWFTPHAETAAGLRQLLTSGKVRSVGVSNYTPSQFAALQHFLGQAPVTNQVQFSLLHLDPLFDGTFDQCQQAGVRPMAWSPTGGGRLFAADEPLVPRLDAVCAAWREVGDFSRDQWAHAWVLHHPAGPISVLGTTQPERIRSAARASAIVLPREAWFALTEAARGARIP